MIIHHKLGTGEKTDMDCFKIFINRMVKIIKESRTEAELATNPIITIINEGYKAMNGENLFELSKLEKLFVKELIRQIQIHNWAPESEEEFKDYIDFRQKLVLPVLMEENEHGDLTVKTIEYEYLEEEYKTLNASALSYMIDIISRVFIFKTLDYKELQTSFDE